MNPPTFGGVMPKSANGNVRVPATWTLPSDSCACAGIRTDFVTPCSVRSPTSVTSLAVPASAAAGTATGWVTVNVAVGYCSVCRPSLRRRLSRRDSSDWIVVVSTVKVPAVRFAPSPVFSTVIEPLTSSVRPTASDSAGRLASCSRTRYPATLPAPTVHSPATLPSVEAVVDEPAIALAAGASVGTVAPVSADGAELGSASEATSSPRNTWS